MKILNILFSIVLFGTAFASIIPHVFPNYWLTDIFSHFKFQYIILLLILFIPALYQIKRRILSLIIIIFLLVWNSWFIIPLYWHDSDIAETSGETLSILSINLLASNTNYPEALELILEKDPDVLILLELNPQWEEKLHDLSTVFPFGQLYPQTNNFGIGILSKTPISSTVTDFGKGFPPSILSELKINYKTVSILATHPVPPVSQDKFKFRNNQLEEIAKHSKLENGNFILAGDLNTSSYSVHFKKLLDNGSLKDSRQGFGIATTWPANFTIISTTLDHFLYRGELQILRRSVERNIGSDHLPIFLQIGF